MDSKPLKTTVFDNADALIAYLDLMGIKVLYMNDDVPLKEKAKRIYDGLLNSFLKTFKNAFSEEEIKENFYVHIYADSILVVQRIKDLQAADKLLHFLMNLHRDLAFGIPTGGITMPSRAILGRGEIFGLHIEEPSADFFNSKLTSVSICGGKAMVELDARLAGLPVGVYLSNEVEVTLEEYKERIELENDLSFVKQPQEAINGHLFFGYELPRGTPVSLEEAIREGLEQAGLKEPDLSSIIRDKWHLWIDAHTGQPEED